MLVKISDVYNVQYIYIYDRYAVTVENVVVVACCCCCGSFLTFSHRNIVGKDWSVFKKWLHICFRLSFLCIVSK